MGPGLEALLASAAKRGADEMADRYLIENRGAAVGVQLFHLRHAATLGSRGLEAQTQVLLGRLTCNLPGWEAAGSRDVQRTHMQTAAEASCRPHASGSGARGLGALANAQSRAPCKEATRVAPSGIRGRWLGAGTT
jgi:hypothetical protein